MVRERDLQGKGPSSILGGGFLLFFSKNTSNNSEVFQYQLKRAATVYEREICLDEQSLERTARALSPFKTHTRQARSDSNN